tara:strand:- start:1108 stop:1995 length:888 start_codon:yes stop_codon:yes gene_type:complete
MALWGLTDALASAPKWLAPKHTFAGTSAFVVAANTDTITIPAHGIADLERLTLVNGAGGNVATAGLYFASVTGDVIKLYTTRANAILSGDTGRVDLTVQGTGHSIQVTPTDVFFVDATEAGIAANRAKGLRVPGWYKYKQRSIFSDNEGSETTLTNVKINGTAGELLFDATPLKNGDRILVVGAVSGNEGAITTPGHAAGGNATTFTVSARAGSDTACTGATLLQEDGATAVVTTNRSGSVEIGDINTDTLLKSFKKEIRNDVELLVHARVAAGTSGDAGLTGTSSDEDGTVADS